MTTSNAGKNLIKSFEGLRLAAYKDAVGVWTIGYGHTGGVKSGMTITQVQADAYLSQDLAKFEKAVSTQPYSWTQNEFDALVSFSFNVGAGNLKKLTNNGKRSKVEIAKKILAYNKAGGKELAGLTRRRKAEHDLFLSDATTSSNSMAISSCGVESTEKSRVKYGMVADCSVLRLRAYPGTDKEVVGRLANGTKVEILSDHDSRDGWYHVRNSSYPAGGFVSTKYIKL